MIIMRLNYYVKIDCIYFYKNGNLRTLNFLHVLRFQKASKLQLQCESEHSVAL